MIVLNPVFEGPLSSVSLFRRSVGGAESNVAIAAARLGVSSGWISRLGNDEFGRHIVKTLRGEGVDTSQVRVDPHSRTGVFFKEISGAPDPQVSYYRAGSAASKMSPGDINSDYIRGARVLYISGITPALSESCRNALQAAVQIAREASVPIAFDPNIRLKLWPIEAARSVLMAVARESDMFFPGLDEAKVLLNRPELDEYEAASELGRLTGAEKVVVKMGSKGALLYAKGQFHKQPAYSVRVVDPTGAGDAFVGAFLASWLRGKSDDESLDNACIAGALAVMCQGDYEGDPDWTQIEAYKAGMRVAR